MCVKLAIWHMHDIAKNVKLNIFHCFLMFRKVKSMLIQGIVMMTSFIKEKCIDTLTFTYWYKYKNCPKRGLYRGHLGVTPVYQCIFGSCAWWAKWFQRLEDIFLRLFHRGKKLTYFTNIKTLWIGAIWGITVFIIVSLWFETCRLGKYMYSYYIVGCYHHYVDDPLGENMCVYVCICI